MPCILCSHCATSPTAPPLPSIPIARQATTSPGQFRDFYAAGITCAVRSSHRVLAPCNGGTRSHLVVLAYTLRTAIVVLLGGSSTTGNTLTGSVTFSTIFPNAILSGGLARHYITTLGTSPRHQRICLSRDRFDFRTGDVILVHNSSLLVLVVVSEHLNCFEVYILYRHVYPQGS